MTNLQIDELALRFDQSEEALFSFFVDDYKNSIDSVPDYMQNDFKDKYLQLVNHLNLTRDIIETYYDEIHCRMPYKKKLETESYILCLRKYIQILGGDPTNCSYIRREELI